MKAVYIRKFEIEIILNDDKKIVIKSDFLSGRSTYSYGEVPDKQSKSFSIYGEYNNDMKNLCDKYHVLLEHYVSGFIKKKHHLRIRSSYCDWTNIPMNNIKSANVIWYCKVVDNPKIKWLEEDLGFKGYSELVFDREQELKALLLKG